MSDEIREGDVLWEPSAAMRRDARLTAYIDFLRARHGLTFDGYEALWRWSADDLEGFWASIVEFFEIPFRTPPTTVLADRRMPGARWFPGATLNYVDAVFARATDAHPALLARSERRPLREISWAELERDVGRAAAGLRRLGVRRGDRVAAFISNIPEAVVGLLATASLGAIWSSCAPEFGRESVVDRFAQIEPSVLLAVDGYTYGGRAFDRRPVLEEIRAALPSIRHTVLIADLDPEARLAGGGWTTWRTLLDDAGADAGADAPRLEPEAVPFDHPLWILYSSGTTGLPKPIVHGHGGVVIEHAKEVGLQVDVRPGDRMLWHTTTGWMMWNFLVGALLVGGTPVLYDGSPAADGFDALWSLTAETGATHFGTSAAFLMACRKEGMEPGRSHDLSALRCIGSTGSPLPVEGFRWVYEAVGRDVWLASISGGTDVVSAFVGGCPLLPVRAGELQCRSLGARIEAFDEAGRPLERETGELVLTAPLPSMPVGFWNDPDGVRLRESYFETYPGVWRHGDWIRFTPSGGAVIEGRSDSTLNRQGIRFGTSELYAVVDAIPEVADSLVVGLEDEHGGYWMPLFVALRPGTELDDGLRRRVTSRIREALSPRHVPDEVIAVPTIPRTLTGKKMEVPVKRILQGRVAADVAAVGSMADPTALEWFERFAADRSR